MAAGLGWFDRYVVDGLINAVWGAPPCCWVGGRPWHLQTGRVGDYVYAVVGGLVLLAAWSQVMSWMVR